MSQSHKDLQSLVGIGELRHPLPTETLHAELQELSLKDSMAITPIKTLDHATFKACIFP